MFHWDYTGKNVVPTIARGVKPGAGAKNRTPHFRHGPKRENTAPDMEFGPLLIPSAATGKNAVKKTGLGLRQFLDHSPSTIPSIFCPTFER